MLGIPADALVEVVGSRISFPSPLCLLAACAPSRAANGGLFETGERFVARRHRAWSRFVYPPVASPSAGPPPLSPRRMSRAIIGKAANIVPGRSPATLNVSFEGARNAMSLSPPEGGHLRRETTTASGVRLGWVGGKARRPPVLVDLRSSDRHVGRTEFVGFESSTSSRDVDADWRIAATSGRGSPRVNCSTRPNAAPLSSFFPAAA